MEATEIAERASNARRKAKLEWYEREIEKRGKSLAAIFRELRDDPERPYLATHSNFEHYCEDRWKMSPRRTQQIVAADTVRGLLTEEAPDLTEEIKELRERPLRELVTTPPAQRVEVIRAALALPEKPGKITAAKLKAVKARIVNGEICEPATKPKPTCPHCGKEL